MKFTRSLIIFVIIASLFAVSCAQPVYHTVKFDSNGGSIVKEQTVEDGKCAEKPEDPTKLGSIFKGWYKDITLTEQYDFDVPVKADKILYAKWLKIQYVTVSFDSNGGSAVEDQKLLWGQKAVEPKDPEKKGSLFNGWYTDETFKYLYNFDDIVMKDTKLHAKWTEVDPTKIYHTVTFDSQGGTPVEKQVVVHGQKAIEPASPTKDGSAFGGWHTDAACIYKYNFDTPVEKDLILYAKWTASSYTITYSVNGATSGAAPESQTGLVFGQDVTLAENTGNLKKNFYVFNGWNAKSDGSGTHYDAGAPVTGGFGGNTTLYAEWKSDSTGLMRVGGTIFYIHEDNGAEYKFFTQDETEITDWTVAGLADAYWYLEAGTKSADKFYVYNNDARVSDKFWGTKGTPLTHIDPTNSNYMTDDVYEYGIGDGKTLTGVYCDDGKEYNNTIWEWLANTVNAGKIGGYDDWFIPCAAELDKLNESGLTDWFSKGIWSSVEYDDEVEAWYWDSEWLLSLKDIRKLYGVAIRAF